MPAHASAQKLIRHRLTSLFLRERGGWTSAPEQAQCFDSIWAATDFAMQHGLDDVESVLHFGSQVSVPCDVYYSLQNGPDTGCQKTQRGYQPVSWSNRGQNAKEQDN